MRCQALSVGLVHVEVWYRLGRGRVKARAVVEVLCQVGWTACGCHGRWLSRLAKVLEEAANGVRVCDNGNHAYLGAALRPPAWEYFIEVRQEDGP